jgi:hypothetical protein
MISPTASSLPMRSSRDVQLRRDPGPLDAVAMVGQRFLDVVDPLFDAVEPAFDAVKVPPDRVELPVHLVEPPADIGVMPLAAL